MTIDPRRLRKMVSPMFRPPYFVETDLRVLDALLERYNFVSLVTVRGELPHITHLPVVYRRVGDVVELCGHWARRNPQSTHAGPATIVVQGPHAYISPSWYPDKEDAARVPTWNYLVAHLHGDLVIFDEEDALADVVEQLTRQEEHRVGEHWDFDRGREDLRSQLNGIVGFRFIVREIQLTSKLNQNHPMANRASVAARLAGHPREASREIGQWMYAGIEASFALEG